ncbi:hypothetical protein HQ533_04895 [Candidatus Woesearchaeota archaeon]|nr:hypothetical protein [Candidatus Woesearchaeota archaeon]
MKTCNICVADKTVKIKSTDTNINLIKKEMKDFLTSKKSKYEIIISESKKKIINKVVKKNGKIIEFWIPEGIKSIKDRYIIKTPHMDGEIYEQKAFFIDKENKNIFLCIRNAIRICYLLWFLKDLMAMHGAGIERNKKGYLFCGPPKEGKTTIAKQAKKVISDECIFVKRVKGKLYMYGTPFGGEIKPLNKKILLTKIFFIKKSNNTEIKKLSKSEKFLKIIENNHLFNKIICKEERFLMKNIFYKTKKTFEEVLAYELEFSLEEDFWRKIDE